MSLIDQLKKYFTGSTTPTNERLKEAVIVAIVIFIIGTLLGIGIQLLITENFLEKAEVDFTLGAFDMDGIGYYFPLKITNSGQKDLTEIYLTFKNCYMDKERKDKIGKLVPTNFEIIKVKLPGHYVRSLF